VNENTGKPTIGAWVAGLFVSPFFVAFALLFIWAGVWGGILPLYSQMRDWRAAASYVPVPAQVEHVTLDTRSSKKLGTSYLTEADFSYEFGGQPYTSRRINLDGSRDGDSRYQKTMYAHLLAAQQNRRPVELWVDPNSPGSGVHDRTLRGDKSFEHLVIGLLCTSVGLWVLLFLCRGWRRIASA